MIVRRATARDVAALAELRELDPADLGFFTAWVEAHGGTHRPFLAEDEAGVALGAAWLLVAERVPGRSATRQFGDIQSVYVRPTHRNRGVGAALIAAIFAEADALGLEHLTVHSRERAVPFYVRAGFRHDGRLLYRERPR
jgi:GNAT superfamily N-acetyltransferase